MPGADGVLLLAYHYGHHAGGLSNWIAHVAISAVIHAVIYGAMFRIMGHLTLAQDLMVVAVVLAALFAWSRARDRRGW